VVGVNARHEVVFAAFEVSFYCLFIIEAVSSLVVIIRKTLSNLRPICVEQSLCLYMRVEPKLWSYLFRSSSLSHTPIQMLWLSRLVIDYRVVLHR
jgi:hypothetical protein